MTEIRFYQLKQSQPIQAVPDLLEKTLERGWRAVVQVPSEEMVEPWAAHLWTYRPDSFLPHGTAKDGNASEQPIWITSEQESPNGATVLFLVNGAERSNFEKAELVCEVFDGLDDEIKQAARRRWKQYEAQGHKLTYWAQTAKGWTKQAG